MLQLADSVLLSTLWFLGLDRDGMNQHTTALMVRLETIKVWPEDDLNAVAWVMQSGNAKEAFDIDICTNDGRIMVQWRSVKFLVLALNGANSNVFTVLTDVSDVASDAQQSSLVHVKSPVGRSCETVQFR